MSRTDRASNRRYRKLSGGYFDFYALNDGAGDRVTDLMLPAGTRVRVIEAVR